MIGASHRRSSLIVFIVAWLLHATALPDARAEDIGAANFGAASNGMPWAVALEKGFFKEAGVDITGVISSLGGGPDLRVLLGGNLRVGLEDNIYLSKGVLSQGSAPLVARAAAYAKSIGRTVVEPSRARNLLFGAPVPETKR